MSVGSVVIVARTAIIVGTTTIIVIVVRTITTIATITVMVRRRGPPSQGWKTFLRNHADGIAAMDLFVVPTVSFRLLYGLDPRDIDAVTRRPRPE
jgi:hypothetical protein